MAKPPEMDDLPPASRDARFLDLWVAHLAWLHNEDQRNFLEEKFQKIQPVHRVIF